MAYGKKTGGRDFQPGQSGNPNGRPAVPDELRRAQKLNKTEFIRIVNEYLSLSFTEIKLRVQNADTPALELIVAKIISEGISRGDPARMNALIDRLIGPVPKVFEGGDEDSNPIKFESLTADDRINLIRAARGEKEK